MATGMAGIWLVTMDKGSSQETHGLGLAILAGLGSGLFAGAAEFIDAVEVARS